jgi:hypothetical protein
MANVIQALVDWVPIIVGLTTAVSIFVFAPLGIFRRLRGAAGAGLITASWILGAILWFYGALATFTYWGWIGLIIGLFVFGVGVVPMGFLALALQSQWEWFLQLGILFVLVFAFRIGGIQFVQSATRS